MSPARPDDQDLALQGSPAAQPAIPAPASRFPTRIHRLAVAERHIDLLAPVDPDALLDDPIVLERYRADDYLPYWPIIWPSGVMLAERILRASTIPPAPPLVEQGAGQPEAALPRAIDLGCGLGMTGIAAALRGWHVTFTDYDPEAVQFAAHNASRNGVPSDRIRPVHMDWRSPLPERFPWVLGSDVLYERRLHPLLLDAIEKLLAPPQLGDPFEPQAWVSDPQRTAAEDFPLAAVQRGFKVEAIMLEGESFNGGRQTGQLFILRKPPH